VSDVNYFFLLTTIRIPGWLIKLVVGLVESVEASRASKQLVEIIK